MSLLLFCNSEQTTLYVAIKQQNLLKCDPSIDKIEIKSFINKTKIKKNLLRYRLREYPKRKKRTLKVLILKSSTNKSLYLYFLIQKINSEADYMPTLSTWKILLKVTL